MASRRISRKTATFKKAKDTARMVDRMIRTGDSWGAASYALRFAEAADTTDADYAAFELEYRRLMDRRFADECKTRVPRRRGAGASIYAA